MRDQELITIIYFVNACRFDIKVMVFVLVPVMAPGIVVVAAVAVVMMK